MMPVKNNSIVEQVVEITESALTGIDTIPGDEYGKCIADFMQNIYDKLVELYKAD